MSFDANELASMRREFYQWCQFIEERLPEGFVDWLRDESDFFDAPASAAHHLSCEGGLLAHSLHVCERLLGLVREEEALADVRDETAVLVGLFHDLCKTGTYRKGFKSKKQKDGSWERVTCYTYDTDLPMGHGEKSVYLLLQHGVKLTDEEALAIRWHMGGWDNAVKGGSRDLSTAQRITRLVTALHCADIQATFFDEEGM